VEVKEEDREPYQLKAKEDRDRHKREMAEYEKKMAEYEDSTYEELMDEAEAKIGTEDVPDGDKKPATKAKTASDFVPDPNDMIPDNWWYQHDDGVKRRVPSSWKFPLLGLTEMYIYWHCGDAAQKISPMKLMQTRDLPPSMKRAKTNLSEVRSVMVLVDQEAARQGLEIKSIMTPLEALDRVRVGYPGLGIIAKNPDGRDRDILSMKWSSCVRFKGGRELPSRKSSKSGKKNKKAPSHDAASMMDLEESAARSAKAKRSSDSRDNRAKKRLDRFTTSGTSCMVPSLPAIGGGEGKPSAKATITADLPTSSAGGSGGSSTAALSLAVTRSDSSLDAQQGTSDTANTDETGVLEI